MAQHLVKVVDDGSLASDDGWVLIRDDGSGDIVFAVERSAAADEEVLNSAWKAAANLVLEEAVREGHVEWRRPPAAS